ncbi:dermonecrotic toxin domain-containing protein [Pseudomonas sp. F01002]|uniref:dermonecrotic toxin domain-containing protein n=1 Tax=Pseudomonas sp. F01002 TaxID=2555724 RepID=UPI00106CA43E|nr:DUF6543 domain-containing protein [Pseudomonas sp. F01002]TFB36251.1 hypothetical protein E3W21_23015 [Pseudomonas sp. F01002]
MDDQRILNPQFKLAEVSEAIKQLSSQLTSAPSFKGLLQECVLKELQRLDPEVYVSRVFINRRDSASASANEPTGVLNDVVMECLLRGRAPVYNAAEYGVYDWRDSTAEEDRHPVLDIVTVGKLITELLLNLPEKYAVVIDRYWSASQGSDATGRPLSTRKSKLRTLYVTLFWRELAVMAAEGGLTPDDEKKVNELASPLLPSAFYGVSVQLHEGGFAALASTFVMRLDGQSLGAIIPTTDSAVILYTPSRGVEKFVTSRALHEALKKRLSEPPHRAELLKGLSSDDVDQVSNSPDIRYSRIDEDVFSAGINAALKKQMANIVGQLREMNGSRSDNEKTVQEIGSMLHLEEMTKDAKGRAAVFIKLISRNARPGWLKESYETNQELYASLEQRLLESEVKLHEATKGASTFKNYVHGVVGDFISPGTDERIDPDTIFVTVRHTVKLADGKKVEHSERKTLTQAFMYGAHDQEGQYVVVVEEFYNNPKLSPSNIVRAIQSLNLRVAYNMARQRVYSQDHVVESMRERLGRKTALTMFGAILQNHVTSVAQDIVQRYNFGDPSIEITGIALGARFKPMKDLMVYRRKSADVNRSTHVLYAPGFPTGQEWFQFPDLKSLQQQIGLWAFDKEGQAYLRGKGYSSEREELEENYHVEKPSLMLQEWWWSSIQLTQWIEDGLLKGSVQNIISWEADEVEVATPRWYRNSNVADQLLLNRLNADFKSIYQISKDKLDIESFHKFARSLVMKTLNEYLSRSGSHPEIDPDEVWVKFHADSKISLTNLFIQWQLWRSDISIFEKFFFGINPFGGRFLDLKEQLRSASFWTFSNQPIAALNAKVINALIDLMPGEKYIEYLRAKFLSAPDVDLKVSLYRKLKQNEMLRSALTQKMKGEMSQEQFNWLKGLIDGFDRDIPRESYIIAGGKPGIGVYEFTLEGRKLEGAYVFGRRVNGREELIIYIPDTPDGKDFFPVEALAARLKSWRYGQHILKLARLEHRNVIENKISRYSHWSGPISSTPVLENSYPVLAFKQEYWSMIGRFIADVDYQTTSPAEAIWQEAKILIDLALDVVSLLIPPVGIVVSMLRITHSVVLGIVASSEGNDKAANAHFATAWRGAITLYIGTVASVGAPVNAVGLLSRIKDITDLVSTVTGVPVGISYITAVAVPQYDVQSTTRLIG